MERHRWEQGYILLFEFCTKSYYGSIEGTNSKAVVRFYFFRFQFEFSRLHLVYLFISFLLSIC
mgnify:CR=1 FL=1